MKTLIELLSKIPFYYLLTISSISVIAGDYYAKLWSKSPKSSFFILAALGYLLSGVFFIPILRTKGLVWASLVWTLISASGFAFIGLVMFKEQLTTLQGIGLIFGFTALILLSI